MVLPEPPPTTINDNAMPPELAQLKDAHHEFLIAEKQVAVARAALHFANAQIHERKANLTACDANLKVVEQHRLVAALQYKAYRLQLSSTQVTSMDPPEQPQDNVAVHANSSRDPSWTSADVLMPWDDQMPHLPSRDDPRGSESPSMSAESPS